MNKVLFVCVLSLLIIRGYSFLVSFLKKIDTNTIIVRSQYWVKGHLSDVGKLYTNLSVTLQI